MALLICLVAPWFMELTRAFHLTKEALFKCLLKSCQQHAATFQLLLFTWIYFNLNVPSNRNPIILDNGSVLVSIVSRKDECKASSWTAAGNRSLRDVWNLKHHSGWELKIDSPREHNLPRYWQCFIQNSTSGEVETLWNADSHLPAHAKSNCKLTPITFYLFIYFSAFISVV